MRHRAERVVIDQFVWAYGEESQNFGDVVTPPFDVGAWLTP